MSTINVVKTLVHADANGQVPNADGFAFDGTHAFAAQFFSVPIWVKQEDTLCVQFSCPSTGAPNGSYALQGSNDISFQEGNNLSDVNLTNWSTLSFWDESAGVYAQTKAIAGAQSFMATIQVLGPRWFRLSWTNTSGSVNPTIRIQLKADGGR